jgi:hypothetical protein
MILAVLVPVSFPSTSVAYGMELLTCYMITNTHRYEVLGRAVGRQIVEPYHREETVTAQSKLAEIKEKSSIPYLVSGAARIPRITQFRGTRGCLTVALAEEELASSLDME